LTYVRPQIVHLSYLSFVKNVNSPYCRGPFWKTLRAGGPNTSVHPAIMSKFTLREDVCDDSYHLSVVSNVVVCQ